MHKHARGYEGARALVKYPGARTRCIEMRTHTAQMDDSNLVNDVSGNAFRLRLASRDHITEHIMDAELDFESNDMKGIAFGLGGFKKWVRGGYFHYELELAGDSFDHRKSMRAYRLAKISKGKQPPKLEDDSLNRELFVIFGLDVSPADAVETLTAIIDNIRSHGLLIGRNAKDDDVSESLDGCLKVVG